MASLRVSWKRTAVTLVLMATTLVLTDVATACSGDTCVNSTHYQTCTGLMLACDEARSCFSERNADSPCLPNPPSCTQPGAFHFHNECDRFYICTRSKVSFVIFCPRGLHFHKLESGVGLCAEPERANCFTWSTLLPPTSLTTTPTVPQVTTEDLPPEPLSPRVGLNAHTSLVAPRFKKTHLWQIFTTVNYGTRATPVICMEEGRFAMENNCRQYILCIRRSKLQEIEPVIKTCPFRQMFEPRLRLCRHDVKCGNRK